MGRAQLSLLGFGWKPQNSLRGARLEREVPEGGHRVAADTQALRRLKQGAGRGGGGCQQKLSPSAERGERWRRAQAPTLARNEAAPEVRQVFSRIPLHTRPQHLCWPVASAAHPAPRGKPSKGGGWQHARGAWPWEDTGTGSVGQRPPSTLESPGRPCPGAVPPPTAPAARPPPPPLGGDLSASTPGAPAHPGSGSAAGTGPPARGTFSSRPTTGVGRSHPETWLCRAGVGGETTAWGRGRGGGDTQINTRAAPAPSAHRASRE